ncbi:hypothetical protein QYE76_027522 [Lolium multiflorum]|uniref:Uncharacterized protein n=1 Tax=Lolium multiflorum TaxID=4521 RepID=A0AAD8QKV7_LOLMU|nr:hypothetical protein QYE76_027522 [Lolium multiflorum]
MLFLFLNFRRIGQEHPASYASDRIFQDDSDADPYVRGEQQMGRTHTPRPDNFSGKDSAAPSANANPQVVERATLLQAECGAEFMEKLASEGRKKKAPTPEAGSSEIPPAKRSRIEIAGKRVTTKRYRKREMPASLEDLQERLWHEAGDLRGRRQGLPSSSAKSGTTWCRQPFCLPLGGNISSGRAAPKPLDHHAEGDFVSPPEIQDTGASNTGTGTEDAEQAEPLVPPSQKKKKKKKKTSSSPSKAVPDSSGPASSSPAKDAPEAPEPAKATPTPPPATSIEKPAPAKPMTPESGKLTAQQLAAAVTAATDPSSGSRTMVLHTGRAAVVASEAASAQIGRITEFQCQGAELGHLLDYAEKWNRADLTPATRGLGKDKLPVVDPSGPRTTVQHFGRLRRAAKEFDNAWHDASSNVTSTTDTRKHLFEELLWEHRELSEAHSKCQALPEVSFEDLSAELAALKAEKEQLTSAHRELKEQAMQAELRHARELKEAKAAAEAKLDETLKEYTDSTAGLRKELEEEAAARKAAQDKIAQLTADQADYDQMVMQIDSLACRIFPDSQRHAVAKVTEHRAKQTLPSLDAPWDGYDYLVALSARIQHMRSIDRHMNDLPDAALQIFKVMWPGEPVPDNVTLVAERLKDAGRRIREWRSICSHVPN